MLLEHSRPFPGTKPSMSRGQTDEHQGEARPFCTFRDPVSRAYHHWLAARQLDRADEHARGLLANAERYGVQKYLAVAHRILGEIAKIAGDLNMAEEQLLHSTEPLGKTPAPLAEWRCHAAPGKASERQNFSSLEDV
jgi:hypothetical protein